MAKIEKPSALDHIDDIVRLSDAVMVARGDLGVEIPHEEVPGRQKELVRACRLAVKPVIVATQMLDSMVTAPTPTRAEASDVATAIYDGADAVMLSAESATGQYPREAVEMMDRIIRSTEQHKLYRSIIEASEARRGADTAACRCGRRRGSGRGHRAPAIVAFTSSGTTAARIARKRPSVPILAMTPDLRYPGGSACCGALTASCRGTSIPMRRWSHAPLEQPSQRNSRVRRIRSSSLQEFHSDRRERPTISASSSWARPERMREEGRLADRQAVSQDVRVLGTPVLSHPSRSIRKDRDEGFVA